MWPILISEKHKLLIPKMSKYGINGQILEWVKKLVTRQNPESSN